MSAPSQTGGAAIGYDVATALWQGKRPYQEDTLLADFHGGMDRGFAVLADGMGGHAAGDLASRLVVIDAVSHLKFLMHDGATLEKNLQAELTSAIETANDVLKDRAADDRRLQGMGTTFLATVMFEDRLYWASVGDSPLYLWREGMLRQLNEDHSMAPVIDQMAKSGEITTEEAANHPDRNALTSVLMGRSLKSMDVPKTATVMDPGDVLIQASDGLQYLDEARISAVLEAASDGATSREIAELLMAALHGLDDPAQDNTAILVLQLTHGMGDGGAGLGKAPAASIERAVETTASGAVAAGTPRAASPRAATPQDVERPPGGRRWLVPAALLGGAVLGLGLIFGLPSEQTTFELAAIPPVLETTDPVGADAPPTEIAAVADVPSAGTGTVIPATSPSDQDVASVAPLEIAGAATITFAPAPAEEGATQSAFSTEIAGGVGTAAFGQAATIPVTPVIEDKAAQPAREVPVVDTRGGESSDPEDETLLQEEVPEGSTASGAATIGFGEGQGQAAQGAAPILVPDADPLREGSSAPSSGDAPSTAVPLQTLPLTRPLLIFDPATQETDATAPDPSRQFERTMRDVPQILSPSHGDANLLKRRDSLAATYQKQ